LAVLSGLVIAGHVRAGLVLCTMSELLWDCWSHQSR